VNWSLSENPPFPPFSKGGNLNSPFCKGRFRGIFDPAQHDFDETLVNRQKGNWLGIDARALRIRPHPDPSTRAPALAEGSCSGFLPTGVVEGPTGLPVGLHMLAPQMPQAKSAKPEQFVELSFLNEVEKDGFFSEMGKRYPSK